MDRLGDIERSALPEHKVDDDRDLAEEHPDKDEQAPQRSAPEFPDARRPLIGNRGRSCNSTCGGKGIHQFAFSLSSCPAMTAGGISGQCTLEQAADVFARESNRAV